jgi:hypothetical protein
MHSPDGKDYLNEWIFQKIEKNRIIIEHIVAPIFTLEVILEEVNQNEVKMTWNANFSDANFLENARDFLIEKNSENFDRLEKELQNF